MITHHKMLIFAITKQGHNVGEDKHCPRRSHSSHSVKPNTNLKIVMAYISWSLSTMHHHPMDEIIGEQQIGLPSLFSSSLASIALLSLVLFSIVIVLVLVLYNYHAFQISRSSTIKKKSQVCQKQNLLMNDLQNVRKLCTYYCTKLK